MGLPHRAGILSSLDLDRAGVSFFIPTVCDPEMLHRRLLLDSLSGFARTLVLLMALPGVRCPLAVPSSGFCKCSRSASSSDLEKEVRWPWEILYNHISILDASLHVPVYVGDSAGGSHRRKVNSIFFHSVLS